MTRMNPTRTPRISGDPADRKTDAPGERPHVGIRPGIGESVRASGSEAEEVGACVGRPRGPDGSLRTESRRRHAGLDALLRMPLRSRPAWNFGMIRSP